jgi:hypothetical protein
LIGIWSSTSYLPASNLTSNRPAQADVSSPAPEITAKAKEEIERLLEAKFIRPIRYTEWLSKKVPIVKKNGKRNMHRFQFNRVKKD